MSALHNPGPSALWSGQSPPTQLRVNPLPLAGYSFSETALANDAVVLETVFGILAQPNKERGHSCPPAQLWKRQSVQEYPQFTPNHEIWARSWIRCCK